MTENIEKIRSVTIRARNGAFGSIFDKKEQSQTLTVYRDGRVFFTSQGCKQDEFGHVTCNAVVRRIVKKIESEQAREIFADFEKVLKSRFEGSPMSSFLFCDALADEFVIRYENADFFYGMSSEESGAAVQRVYAHMRSLLGIRGLLDLDDPYNSAVNTKVFRRAK